MQILVLLNGQKVITLESQKAQFDAGGDTAVLGLFSTLNAIACAKENGESVVRSYTPLEEPTDSSKGPLIYNCF